MSSNWGALSRVSTATDPFVQSRGAVTKMAQPQDCPARSWAEAS